MIKTTGISDFHAADINFSNISCVKQYWHNKETFSYLEVPRNNSGIILTTHCNIHYYFSDGTFLELPKRSVLILPAQSSYSVEVDLLSKQQLSSITINFDMFDNNFNPITFDNPYILMYKNVTDNIEKQFLNTADSYINIAKNTFLLKSNLFRLLHTLMLSPEHNNLSGTHSISTAINYIENNLNSQISVSTLAKLCATSESSLRRNFKSIIGMSPIEYMNKLKIQKAQQLLEIPEVTINTLCEQLNFYDTSYFYKLFKRYTNTTPIQYRKQYLK